MLKKSDIRKMYGSIHKFFEEHPFTAKDYPRIKDSIYKHPLVKLPLGINDDGTHTELDGRIPLGSVGIVVAELRIDMLETSDKDLVVAAFINEDTVVVMSKKRFLYLVDTVDVTNDENIFA